MSTDELLPLLDDLAAELKVRDRPERRAWNTLEPSKSGWTARVYDDRAFDIWHEVLQRFPDDLSAVHHLAIMHHARAIDLEQSQHPAESDPDWRRALEYWQRLCAADEFWSALSGRVKADPDPVPRVRQDLAERLLKLHFDIAADERSPHHRARFHIRLALDSGFAPQVVERSRSQAYERAIGGLDATVWRPGTLEPEVLKPAVETIIRYLERDDGWGTTLKDLLRLLNRLAVPWIQQVNAITDTTERTRALTQLLADFRRYNSHTARLQAQLLAAADPDTLAFSELALWYSRAGQACQAADAFEESAGYYEHAWEAARVSADPREPALREEWVMSTVLAARECAKDDVARCHRLLARISSTMPVPGTALLVRAEAWLLLDDLDRAERDAEAALRTPQAQGHAVAQDEFRAECLDLRELIRRNRLVQKINPLMEEARRYADAKEFAKAVRTLGAVLSLDGEWVPALVARAECHLARFETAAAKSDLDCAEQLSRVPGAARMRTALGELRSSLASMENVVRERGGPEAFRLQQQSVKASNGGHHDTAVKYLRQALAVAAPTGVGKLRKDLAQCLLLGAVELVESTGHGEAGEALMAILRARGMVREAARLDAANPDTARILSQLDEIVLRMTGLQAGPLSEFEEVLQRMNRRR